MEAASMLEARFESALARSEQPTGTYVSLREISERGMIDLRGASSDKKFMAAAKSALGLDLPKQPRTSAAWGDIRVFWLSPDQWLITCPRAKAQDLADGLAAELTGIHSLAVNVSDMRAIIRLEGEGVREVVMKGTAIDLTHGDYPPGTVRRMRFAEIAALLHVVEENVIDIYIFRSYAQYTWDFLSKAARKGSEVRVFPKAV
jgi:sarcosine oxidase subunit gamma